MREIKPVKTKDGIVRVPGSKSYSHRLLIASALSDGVSSIHNCLKSEDISLTAGALIQMGVRIENKNERLIIHGKCGKFNPTDRPVYLANSGTSMRLLTAAACLGEGTYKLTGTQRMYERPVKDLLTGLQRIHADVGSENNNGCPPIIVTGNTIRGGKLSIDCSKSSQYLSALLLIGPYLESGLEIKVTQGPVSKPYIDMTLEVMKRMGITVEHEGYHFYRVNGGQVYRAGTYYVEPDYSQAGYFWAAAAITGSSIKVRDTNFHTRQGDVGFVRLLEAMGCNVESDTDGITVTGRELSGIKADMGNMPDIVPTLAVVAAFAQGTTVIENVGHLKIKESDRLGSVVAELNKMGVEARCSDTAMTIRGGRPRGTEIETYDDHRMAMSFALAGLRTSGVHIKNETCVEKSFPKFWDVLEGLYG